MQQAEAVANGIRRLVAPNPSPLTHQGTNTYVLGHGRVAIVDPGPADDRHLAVLLEATRGEIVEAILVTHPHLDHSGLAPALSRASGAPVYAAGRAEDGRSAAMQGLAATGLVGGGEGLDHDFTPDFRLTGGDRLAGGGWEVEAIATPGHLGTHLAFAVGQTVLSGDHVMGWSTSIVSPPDGDMGDYMASLDRLDRLAASMLLPGHGPVVEDPAARIAELRAHRLDREASILRRIAESPATAAELAADLYTDTPPALLPAAERNVLAHLLDLAERKLVSCHGPVARTARFAPA